MGKEETLSNTQRDIRILHFTHELFHPTLEIIYRKNTQGPVNIISLTMNTHLLGGLSVSSVVFIADLLCKRNILVSTPIYKLH